VHFRPLALLAGHAASCRCLACLLSGMLILIIYENFPLKIFNLSQFDFLNSDFAESHRAASTKGTQNTFPPCFHFFVLRRR
jgi:hypothetical protein